MARRLGREIRGSLDVMAKLVEQKLKQCSKMIEKKKAGRLG